MAEKSPALAEAGIPERRLIPPRRKAAIAVVAMGAQLAAEVFKHLTQDEVDELVLEIAALDRVSPEEKDNVLKEFYDSAVANSFVSTGGVGMAKEILERALGDRGFHRDVADDSRGGGDERGRMNRRDLVTDGENRHLWHSFERVDPRGPRYRMARPETVNLGSARTHVSRR